MNAAATLRAVAQPDTVRDVVVTLTAEEQAAIAAACLGMSVQLFMAADRLEGLGQYQKADAVRHDALVLSRAELSVRNASR